MMKLCPACKGQKKVWGAGMMAQHECKTCKGIGKIDEPEIIEEIKEVNIGAGESGVGDDVVVVVSDNKPASSPARKAKPKAKSGKKK